MRENSKDIKKDSGTKIQNVTWALKLKNVIFGAKIQEKKKDFGTKFNDVNFSAKIQMMENTDFGIKFQICIWKCSSIRSYCCIMRLFERILTTMLWVMMIMCENLEFPPEESFIRRDRRVRLLFGFRQSTSSIMRDLVTRCIFSWLKSAFHHQLFHSDSKSLFSHQDNGYGKGNNSFKLNPWSSFSFNVFWNVIGDTNEVIHGLKKNKFEFFNL